MGGGGEGSSRRWNEAEEHHRVAARPPHPARISAPAGRRSAVGTARSPHLARIHAPARRRSAAGCILRAVPPPPSSSPSSRRRYPPHRATPHRAAVLYLVASSFSTSSRRRSPPHLPHRWGRLLEGAVGSCPVPHRPPHRPWCRAYRTWAQLAAAILHLSPFNFSPSIIFAQGEERNW
jgi:hypothetical protein